MSFYDTAGHWLDDELRRERMALTDALHTRLASLLRDPAATRRSIRHGFVVAIQGAPREATFEAQAAELTRHYGRIV